jgi:hypothetical protein
MIKRKKLSLSGSWKKLQKGKLILFCFRAILDLYWENLVALDDE